MHDAWYGGKKHGLEKPIIGALALTSICHFYSNYPGKYPGFSVPLTALQFIA